MSVPSIKEIPNGTTKAGAVLREGGTLEQLAFGFVDRGDGDRGFVWIDSDQDLHAHLRFGRTSACGVCEGHSDYFGLCFHASFESLSPPRAPAGRKPRTSQPISRGRQEVRERSLYNRYPRSLAALQTTELLIRVKQVGSSLASNSASS